MTRIWAWLKCKCTCIEADTIEFDTMSDVVRDYHPEKHSNPAFRNRPFERETSDVQQARNALANKLIEQGLTFKHAWYQAFQAHPRVYLDDAPQASAPSTDDCDAGKAFFKPRV